MTSEPQTPDTINAMAQVKQRKFGQERHISASLRPEQYWGVMPSPGFCAVLGGSPLAQMDPTIPPEIWWRSCRFFPWLSSSFGNPKTNPQKKAMVFQHGQNRAIRFTSAIAVFNEKAVKIPLIFHWAQRAM